MDEVYQTWDNSDIAILPVPYDKTSTWIKGADKGPLAILEASEQIEMYDIETHQEVYKKGIHTCESLDVDLKPEDMVEKVKDKTEKLLDSEKFVVLIGGEHSVSLGAVMAHNAKFENISVLQLDAHADLREEYEGSPYNHACVMARIKEICPIVQVGVRSLSVEEKEKVVPEKMFFARDIKASPGTWQKDVVNQLSENVYVSIDVDVFDPSIIPSTGTPQPGGLDWYEVTSLLKEVAKNKKVVGFDVVELCPDEKNKAPDITAAKLVYKFLSYIFSDK